MNVKYLQAVPNLTTAMNGPLHDIENALLNDQTKIETWFRHEWQKTKAPVYASVDLRNAGFKLAPIDTNLFPAGFNNINPSFFPLCIQAFQSAVEHICPDANRILIIPENHTRNTFYLDNLRTLIEIISNAGFEVKLGSLMPELKRPMRLETASGRHVTLEPITRENNRISVGDFDPCMLLLNNDLSAGFPELLENLEQVILPSTELGWNRRLKSNHFNHYHHIVAEFSRLVAIDPWLIEPLFLQCGEINFQKREGEACLEENIDALLTNIGAKYREYGLKDKPYVILKADAGTYGMGVMAVHSASEIKALNRKQRTKMSSSKGGSTTDNIILQEGVYTFETWGEKQSVTEPVVYMIDHFVVGGFYRVHTRRGPNENLNAPGMHFEPLAFAKNCNSPNQSKAPDASENRFYAYGVIARLALLAAARELDQVKQRPIM